MADEPKAVPEAKGFTVGPEESTSSVSFGYDKKPETVDGNSLTPEQIAELEAEGDDPDAEKPLSDGTDGEEAATTDGDLDAADDDADKPADDGAELPEFDLEDDAVVEQYESRYLTTDDDGAQVLNFEAFNPEFEASIEAALADPSIKPDLKPGTRAFLKKRFGISDKLIDNHLQGQLAAKAVAEQTFYTKFDADPAKGKVQHEALLGWAKDNYTPAQKARYNAAMEAGGAEAEEQIELLKTRSGGKVTPTADPAKTTKRRLGITPKKSATNKETVRAIASAPFANASEYNAEQKRVEGLPKAEREVERAKLRTRLEQSNFYKG